MLIVYTESHNHCVHEYSLQACTSFKVQKYSNAQALYNGHISFREQRFGRLTFKCGLIVGPGWD